MNWNKTAGPVETQRHCEAVRNTFSLLPGMVSVTTSFFSFSAAACCWMDFPAACKGQTNEIKECCRTHGYTAAAPRSAAGSLQRNFIYLHLRDTIYQKPQWHSAGRERERERERGGLCREAERVQKQDSKKEKRVRVDVSVSVRADRQNMKTQRDTTWASTCRQTTSPHSANQHALLQTIKCSLTDRSRSLSYDCVRNLLALWCRLLPVFAPFPVLSFNVQLLLVTIVNTVKSLGSDRLKHPDRHFSKLEHMSAFLRMSCDPTSPHPPQISN